MTEPTTARTAETDSPNQYVRGKLTVITNETGSQLVVPQINDGGQALIMQPEDAIDLEDIARPAVIEHSGINRLAKQGFISFHPKGSSPKGKKRETLGAGDAPPNEYDRRHDEVVRREEERNKKTEASALRRSGSE